MDQGSTMKRSAVHNFAPTVTKFCVMWEWEGQALPHDTKFGNSRCEIVGRRVIFIWSLIHGLRWSGLIKAEPGLKLERAWIHFVYSFCSLCEFCSIWKACNLEMILWLETAYRQIFSNYIVLYIPLVCLCTHGCHGFQISLTTSLWGLYL